MFFVELDEGDLTLENIKRIAQHIADDYNHLVKQFTEEDLTDLSFMLKPTLQADHNEEEIRKRWQRFVNEFVLNEEQGKPMKFFRSEDKNLYFGDKAGMEMAKKLSHNSEYPTQPHHL